MLTGDDPFGGGLKTCSYSAAFMAENAETLVPQGLTEAQFSGAQAKGQLGAAWAKMMKGEIAEGAKVAEGLSTDGNTTWTLLAGKGKLIVKKYLKSNPVPKQYTVTNPESGFIQELMDEAKWKFGNASAPTVSAEPVVAAAKVVSTGPVTPAKLHKVLEAAGFKKSHTTKLKTTHTGAVYGGGTSDTTGYVVQKKISGDYEILCKSMTQAEKQKLVEALQAAGYQAENKFGNFIDVKPGSVTQKVEQVAKEVPPTPTASAGAMSDEDVASLFVLIKDKLAKEKGLNIKGANPALDKEVFAEIGSRIGYTAQQVSDKVDAYKATGKKLSALKKKVLKDKPKVPPKPKPATVPDEVVEEKAVAAVPEARADQALVDGFKQLVDLDPNEIQWLKQVSTGVDAYGKPIDEKFSLAAKQALKEKGHDWSDAPNGVPTQATKDIVDDVVDDMSEKGLMHDHYTDQDLAAQYIMAKDQVVADSGGKWTLYTQNNAEFDDAIYAMIKDVTNLDRATVEQGVKNYVSSGKKLSVLKKQLIKQGTMKKAAPTLKGGTKATKENVKSFADKGFDPKDYKPIRLGDAEKQEIYNHFKTKQGTYLSSSEGQIYDAIMETSQWVEQGYLFQPISELQVLRIIDEMGAKKFGVTNDFLFEKKLVPWTASPAGRAYVQAKLKAAELEKNAPPLPADSKGFDTISVEDARAMQQRAERWTEEQKQSLRTYTGGTYAEWNKRLRSGGAPTPSMQRAIDGMRPTDRQFLVHRGTGYKQFGVSSYEELLSMVGDTVHDKAFLSTSVGGSAAFSGEVRMTIEVVKGTKGAFVKDISNFSHENEFVIAPGTKMKILQVKKHGYVTEVRLRVVL